MKFRLCRIRLAPTGACLLAMAVLFFLTSARHAQGLTGQISGTVVDSVGGAVPGATVNVRNAATQVSREAVTERHGAFVIADLLAGTYDVTVSLEGFKSTCRTAWCCRANERVALRAIALQVGALVGDRSRSRPRLLCVQTAELRAIRAHHPGAAQGGNAQGTRLHGHAQTAAGRRRHQNREAPGWNNIGGLAINGGRNNTINLTYDGVTNLDTGSNTGPFLAPGSGLDRRNQGADVELSRPSTAAAPAARSTSSPRAAAASSTVAASTRSAPRS